MRRELGEAEKSTAQIVDLSAEGPSRALERPLPVRDPTAEDSTLAGRLWTLVEGRWLIAAIAGTTIFLAALYLLVATPIYRSVATLQVEETQRTLPGLEQLSQVFGERTPAETEIEILRSRMLIRGVVEELGLDLRVEPRRFPVVGSALARRHKGRSLAAAPFGLDQFAWGGERINVRRVEVSEDLYDEPLTLTALQGGRFRVRDPGGNLEVEGEVGKVASASNGDRSLEIFVSELSGRPGVEFHVRKVRQSDVVDRLVEQLKVTERGRSTGILVMTLDGPNPARTSAILDAISRSYVRQNVDRKSAEAAKTLEFLDEQLPLLKRASDSAQAALKSFQVDKGSVDLSSETTSLLERSVEVDRAIQELEMQRAELRQRFTENHPALASLNDKAQQLKSERAAIMGRMREVPANEADSARLLRDVQSTSELYTVLLNKSQELRVMKSGTVGNVRILDEATTPRKPNHPNAVLVLAIAAVLGLGGGIAGVFLRKALDPTTDDPDDIESGTGLPVYATIPHSPRQEAVARAGPGERRRPLAAIDPGDIAIENLRSLRTSLQFAMVESRNNVVAFSGPALGVGKSFIAVNLAHVLASPERRVLLVDCDLRRGRLHRHFGVERGPGVTDVVSGTIDAASAVRTTENAGLDVLPTGRIPPNPAELLSSNAFKTLIDWASHRYAYVVLDTPPVLAVTDPTITARLAGVNLLVVRAGAHSLREISAAVRKFSQVGVAVQGAVLNDVRASMGRYGKHGRYQRYEYRSHES